MSHVDEFTVFELGESAWNAPADDIDAATKESPDEDQETEADQELAMSLVLGNATKALAADGLVSTPEPPAGVGVLRLGNIGLMASASERLHGGTGPTPEPPPSGAKRIGGRGYDSSSDDGEGAGAFGGPGGFAQPAHGLPSPHLPFPPSERARQRAAISEEEVAAQDMHLYVTCRNYFFLGCLALPLLHLVNAWYFRKELIGRDDIDAHPLTKQYARLSLFVAFVWIAAFAGWLVAFHKVERLQWLSVLNSQLKHLLI